MAERRKRPDRQPARARPVRSVPKAKQAPRLELVRKKAPPPASAPSEVEKEARPSTALSFPIVGIGASAGGLEALELFLKNVPQNSGMAFIIVQHLDPDHKGTLAALLQRATSMPVAEVTDGMRVEPNRVYLIPPNKDMSILHGVLHLRPQASPKGLRLPIDFFFRSLAEDQQERSIGVVLSGMGSDGTLGLRAIKENAGASFVQALSSAKFDGMPRSAIDAGLADIVAAAEELPGKIVTYTRHAPHLGRPTASPEEKTQSALNKIFFLLRARTGNEFSSYKKTTIYRRIERRMGLHQIDTLANYVTYLRENPPETDLLFRELLIGVTSFFRDPAAWEHLVKEVLPRLFAEYPAGAALRAWVPGCSTGEEAYSLAIAVKEALAYLKSAKNIRLQIFATDVDKDSIERARAGLYPTNIAADVSPERLQRFFIQDDRGYRVSKEIREMVTFAPQNLISDPPFTRLDILSCRNLLIYLSTEVQKRLIPLFHYSLNPRGILFLGSAETIGSSTHLFTSVNDKTRIYRRNLSSPTAQVEFPSSFGSRSSPQNGAPSNQSPATTAAPNLQTMTERVLVQRFSPAAVLTTDKGDILYFSGRTGKYLEPAAGRANLNVFTMAREGLRHKLGAAFNQALREERAVSVQRVRVPTNGSTQVVNLSIEKLSQPETLRGTVMIVFTDAPSSGPSGKPEKSRRESDKRIADLEEQLQHALEETQSIREEMQTSQEELKSTNEELQSTNEELQSTNEQLSTSKEEMQSLNEELQMVNHELQAKIDELSRNSDDMTNLLNSTDIATLFLDDHLNVRRFTTETMNIIKLIRSDAGRPITDIRTELDYPRLAEDARGVLRTLLFKETVVSARNGRWYSVRILPYRTVENVIAGVVITFTDVTAAKKLEMTLRDQANQLRQIAEAWPHLIWGARPDGTWDLLSRQWVVYTGVSESEQLGYGWLEQIHTEDRRRVREAWKAAVKSETPLDIELRIRGKSGEHRWFKARGVPIRGEDGTVVRWYGASMDIEELKHPEGGRKAGRSP